MFKNMIAKIKAVFYKMGLIKSLQKVTDHRDIPVNDKMYDLINMWKCLYAGYYEEWHEIKYKTINGEKQRTRASMRMPKVVSQKMTSLIFNEKCEVNISDEATKEFIKEVLKNNDFYREFPRYLEYGFALSGMTMKPYYEDGQIKISYTAADCFIPLSWNNTKVTEGVFVSTFRKGNKYYSHLEWNIWEIEDNKKRFVVKNELYESESSEELGMLVPLDKHFVGLEPVITFDEVKKPLFSYFKPNLSNNFDTNSPIGISIFANATDTLKTLDIAFDSFQREFILGKKRIIVPASAIKTVVDPENGTMKRYFDSEDEVYQAMNLGGGMDSEKVHDISVELRVEEHIGAINALLNILAMQIGFNAGTFTFDGTAVKTATEVISENSETFRTKQDHETNVEAAIKDLVDAILEVAHTFDLFKRPEKYDVTVSFDDSIAEDQTAEISKQIQLITNGLQSKKRAIMKIYGYTEKEAEELLLEVGEERKTQTAEEIDMFGMNK